MRSRMEKLITTTIMITGAASIFASDTDTNESSIATSTGLIQTKDKETTVDISWDIPFQSDYRYDVEK